MISNRFKIYLAKGGLTSLICTLKFNQPNSMITNDAFFSPERTLYVLNCIISIVFFLTSTRNPYTV